MFKIICNETNEIIASGYKTKGGASQNLARQRRGAAVAGTRHFGKTFSVVAEETEILDAAGWIADETDPTGAIKDAVLLGK